MKWICVLLVLGNVCYYGLAVYEQRLAAYRQPAELPPLPADAAVLRLLSELDELPPLRENLAGDAPIEPAATEQEVVTVIDAQPAATAAGVCISAGPYSEEADALRFQEWLNPRAVRLVRDARSVETERRYWVYLEPMDNGAARDSAADLRNQGVQDFMLIDRDDGTSLISLGVFSYQESVARRLEEMEGRGYNPIVVPQNESSIQHWFRAELAAGFEDLSDMPEDIRAGIDIVEVPCP